MTHNPPATEGLAAGLAEFVRETAWVIENTLPNQPEYFCGGKAGRSFSPDHMQAIRFIRREDAAACADFFPISQAIHAEVREHIWLEPAALSVSAERSIHNTVTHWSALATPEQKPGMVTVKALGQAIWDAVQSRIESAPADGMSATGTYSADVMREQGIYIDGLRAARLAAMNAVAAGLSAIEVTP